MSSLVKTVAWLLGVILLVIGIAGFVTGDMLLVFQVDATHNIVHVLSGVAGICAALAGRSYARLYLIVFGIVYALVTLLGFVMSGDILGLFHVNEAGNYLHAAIAFVALIVGFGGRRSA